MIDVAGKMNPRRFCGGATLLIFATAAFLAPLWAGTGTCTMRGSACTRACCRLSTAPLALSFNGSSCRVDEPIAGVSDDMEDTGSQVSVSSVAKELPAALPAVFRAGLSEALSTGFLPLPELTPSRADRPLHLVNSVFRI